MVNHAVPTEKLCVPFSLHPVVERVSVFKFLYNTTQAAHCQDDFPNFGTKNSKPTLLENSLEQLNIRYKLIKPYTLKAQDFKRQLAVRERTYNHFSIRPLNRKSPDYFLNAFSLWVTHH